MKATKIWVFIVLLLIPAINVHAYPIPDTGQTKCYNNTVEIPCPAPGEAFYGQDGSYTINPPSYTKLDASGATLPNSATTWAMVRDNVTGLIWEMKTDDSDFLGIHYYGNTYTWENAQSMFIATLNQQNFGGFSDWWLPTIKDLSSLVKSSIPYPGPAIDAAWFPRTVSSDYWSSTSYVGDKSYAWQVAFASGGCDLLDKSRSYFVRAVRAGQSASLGHWVSNGDGTVTDTATGLMWQQGTSPSRLTWEAALSYGEGLSLAGYEDWRMPTLKELRSIVDYSRWNPAIDTTFSPGMVSPYYYWSSTTDAHYTYYAWLISFDSGNDGLSDKSNSNLAYIRAVRAGQSRSLGHLIISSPGQADRWNIGEQKAIIWDTAGILGNAKITISRQGGKTGTFETIIESTENDGTYNWTVTGPVSVNCVLKIEPLNDPSKATSQGLFSISGGTVIVNPEPDAMNATASWIMTGPNSFNWTGAGDLTLNNLAVGNYTIVWGDIPGWIKPSPATETKSLTSGGTITFSGTYLDQTIPVIQVAPLSLNFRYVPIGSTKDLTLMVKNVGGGTLTGNATTSAPFSIVSAGSYTLDPDQGQIVTVRYQPTSQGPHTGTVVFTGGGGATVQVTGKTEKPLGLPWLLLLLGN